MPPGSEGAEVGHSMMHGTSVGSWILFALLSKTVLGEQLQHGYMLRLSPLAFARWLGLLVTALNLLPIGQLDGGHMLYCLLGRPARTISLWIWRAAVGWILYTLWRGTDNLAGWLVTLALIGMMGVRHPPTANDNVPLGPARTILGWITLPFIFIGFTPNPITIEEIRFVWEVLTRWPFA